MPRIEINGYDESGEIGDTVRFIRVGMDVENQLRPFVYNIFHFGTLTISKEGLRDMSERKKRKYIKNVFTDSAFSINQYYLSKELQLFLLRKFFLSEFNYIDMRRRELIRAYETENWEDINKAIYDLRKYVFPWRYIEPCIKSYAYRYIINELRKTSKVLRDPRIRSDCRVFSYIDGGFPFVFWAPNFLDEQGAIGNCFSRSRTPIFGISHGDQYYPTVSLAGNIAQITKNHPSISFPFRIREIPLIPNLNIDEFMLNYSQLCSRPSFLRRILFFGDIPNDLQFTIPYIHFMNTRRIWEPFRITRSFRGFYKEFRGDSSNDLVVKGNIRPHTNDEDLVKECSDFGLKVINASEFKDLVLNFLARIFEESEETNLTLHERDVLNARITRIENTVNKYEII